MRDSTTHGIFNMSNTNETSQGNVIAGFVLLTDANMDWPRFRHYLKEDWGIVPEDEVKDGALIFKADGMTVACSLMPNPVPDNEAEDNAKRNYLWKNGVEETAKHKAHVMLAVMDKTNALEQALLLAKVASSMLKLKNAIGIYKNSTVYPKDFYVDFAETIKQDELPMPILIYVGMYITKDSLVCGFTSGLRTLGCEEIEVVDSKAQPSEMYSFLLSIAEYVVSSGAELKDGETIGFSEDEKLPITVSDGVSVQGQTIKIGFKTE